MLRSGNFGCSSPPFPVADPFPSRLRPRRGFWGFTAAVPYFSAANSKDKKK